MKNISKLSFTIKNTLCVLVLIFFVTGLNAQVVSVWAVGDGEKIFKHDTGHPAKTKNSIWDEERIDLRGLYNEILGFQIIVEVDSTAA